MRRKMYDRLLEWKNTSNGASAVLVDGARRVGKSYTVKEFVSKEYKSYIIIDFQRATEDVLSWFDQYLDDLDRLFMLMKTKYNTQLYERESAIVFDEVQLCPRARAAIKYLVYDGRYDYIETGSLMSIRANIQDIVVPSEEEHVSMYPMDFEEFVWAMDKDAILESIAYCFDRKIPMGPEMHKVAMDLFREYMIVGGMPQAVEEYRMTHDFDRVDRVKRRIIDLYRADISKHATGYEGRVRAVLDTIPSQLSRHEKKFRITAISESARMRTYADAFFWLTDAMIVNNCYNSTEPNVGLVMNMDSSSVKCYMADTGLLLSMAFSENEIVSRRVYYELLTGDLIFNEGMVMENMVAQMLVSSGHRLFFYVKNSEDREDRMEIDFLISKSIVDRDHNVSPIEVKSGKRYSLTSLKKYTEKYRRYLDTPYVLHVKDLAVKDGIVYLPLYMTYLL